MRLLVALGMAVIWSGAQAQMKISAVQLAKPPVIDGTIGEGEWKEASHLSTFYNPYTAKPADDGTEVWIAYDSEFIYLAFKMHDAEPSKIMAKGTQPDAIGGDDQVTINIDPFNKRSYGCFNTFSCNPNGVHTESLAGGRSAKREWRGLWLSAAKVVDDGWVAEMRIPWKIMSLPGAGKHDAAVYFERVQQRTAISSQLPDLSPQGWYDRSAAWTGLILPAPKEKTVFYQGYLSAESVEGKTNAQLGADIRFRLSPKMTALATLNPDFSNVEQSVAGIEYMHSERYLDDSRPFFNEGDTYFQLYDSWGSLFYSRRVGDFDFGGKVYGNIGSADEVGLMAAQTGGDETDLVYRYCHLWSPRRSVTLYGSSLLSPDVTDHTTGTRIVYGIGDANLVASGSMNDGVNGTKYAGSGNFAYFKGPWSAQVMYDYIEPNFSPALGYVRFNDRRGGGIYASYYDRRPAGYIRSISSYILGGAYDHFDGSNQLQQLYGYIGVSNKNNMAFSLSMDSSKYDDVYEQVLSGSLSSSNRAGTYGAYISGNYGERGGETTSYLSFGGSYRVSNKLTFSLGFSEQTYFSTARQTIFTASQVIDAKRTLSARVVWQDSHTNAYLAFKSAGFTGMDWYLIVGDPNAQEWKDRIVVKLVWAW